MEDVKLEEQNNTPKRGKAKKSGEEIHYFRYARVNTNGAYFSNCIERVTVVDGEITKVDQSYPNGLLSLERQLTNMVKDALTKRRPDWKHEKHFKKGETK